MMKSSGRLPGRLLLAAGFVLAICVATGQPASAEAHGEQTLVGEVFAEQYDENGEVSGVSIFDDNWGTVMVSPAGQGRELLSRVGMLVEATGEVEETEEGDYVITVKTYRIVQDDEDQADAPEEGE